MIFAASAMSFTSWMRHAALMEAIEIRAPPQRSAASAACR